MDEACLHFMRVTPTTIAATAATTTNHLLPSFSPINDFSPIDDESQ
jgi:hypothetical protein